MSNPPPICFPLIDGCDLIATARGSMASTNSKGESPQPCLVDRERRNLEEMLLFV